MKCTYCGGEVADHHLFCMSCGTRVDRSVKEPEPVVQEPIVREPERKAPVAEAPRKLESVPGFLEKTEERRVTIDPEKFRSVPADRSCPQPQPSGDGRGNG